MTISEKVAYLKGMFDGMALDTEKSKEAKLIGSILEVLEEVGMALEDIDTSFDTIDEEINNLNDDVSNLENAVFEDTDVVTDLNDDFDEDFLEVECPNCGESLCIDADVLEDGVIQCPNCERKFAVSVDSDCGCDEDDCCCFCDDDDDDDEVE